MTTLLSVQLRLAQQVRPFSTAGPSVVSPSITPVSTALKPAKSDTSTSLKAATRATHHQVRRQLDAIAQDLLSPDSFTLLLQASGQTAKADTQHITDAMLSEQYAKTCLSLWQLAQSNHQSNHQSSHQFPDGSPLYSHLPSQAQTAKNQLERLCRLWAIGKYRRPDQDFFKVHSTAFIGLRYKWQHPDVQASIHHATTLLVQSPADPWIASHSDGWAYLVGVLMHQLLQWNHSLTPQCLRELLHIDEGKPA